tara:strand:+ start:313 stop:1083 length:771 start_codon:yes stop_codon:yes gene_type:complete
MNNKIIFDVGAYDGIDGLALAIKNPNFLIYAFEANPSLIETINSNKLSLEKRLGKKISNYRLFNKAVSNENKKGDFLISKNPTGSSLKKFSSDLDRTWPGYRETHFHVVKKINVDVITLEKFCSENEIKNINYLHIDTQGNDLNVLKGLGKLRRNVQKGILEASIDKENALYEDNHTLKDVENYFEEHDYKIVSVNLIDKNIKNEVNIKFENKKFSNPININTNYNTRYFFRVLNNKTYLKDDIKDFFLRLLNTFF